MSRGFTILEMSYVVTVIAVLTAITVPAHHVVLRRAQTAEARSTLSTIAHAELQHYRDHGEYLACGPAGAIPTEPSRFPTADCWRRLGVDLADTVRYRYSVTVQGGSFVVHAEGDLDGDGAASRFQLDGRTFEISSEDELE